VNPTTKPDEQEGAPLPHAARRGGALRAGEIWGGPPATRGPSRQPPAPNQPGPNDHARARRAIRAYYRRREKPAWLPSSLTPEEKQTLEEEKMMELLTKRLRGLDASPSK